MVVIRFSTKILRAYSASLWNNLKQDRERRALKKQLIRQMRSTDNRIALQAVDALREHGWLSDGSLRFVNLSRADLTAADLTSANLIRANLYRANLQGAFLRLTNLEHAELKMCNLLGAMSITRKQIQKVAGLLGAVLPDGKKLPLNNSWRS